MTTTTTAVSGDLLDTFDAAALTADEQTIVAKAEAGIARELDTIKGSIVAIGQHLATVRTCLKQEGQWLAWLRRATPFSPDTAENYIRAATTATLVPNYPAVAELLAPVGHYIVGNPATPESARQEIIARLADGERVTAGTARAIAASHRPASGTSRSRGGTAAAPAPIPNRSESTAPALGAGRSPALVPHVTLLAPQHHPYRLPALTRLVTQYHTATTVRAEQPDGRLLSVQLADALCLPVAAAWPQVQTTWAALQTALTALADGLRALGGYAVALSRLGFKRSPNPLSPTVIQIADPDGYYPSSYVVSQTVPRISRRVIERHTPQMMVLAADPSERWSYSGTTGQRDTFVCPDDDAWTTITALHGAALAAHQRWETLRDHLGTYDQALADGRYAPGAAPRALAAPPCAETPPPVSDAERLAAALESGLARLDDWTLRVLALFWAYDIGDAGNGPEGLALLRGAAVQERVAAGLTRLLDADPATLRGQISAAIGQVLTPRAERPDGWWEDAHTAALQALAEAAPSIADNR